MKSSHQDLAPGTGLLLQTSRDPTLMTLHDNKIKTDVNNIRSLLSQSGYRTRLVVILLSDKSISSVEGIQERLENIRRGGGIDQKALLPGATPGITGNSGAHSRCCAHDHLRPLHGVLQSMGRHVLEEERTRDNPQPTVPPAFGTSQKHSANAGWNIRYDFKSAVFAEFRQEMDAALRSWKRKSRRRSAGA